MKIGILNAYDARNRGDLAIVLCQIEVLRQRFPGAEFLVFSHHAASNESVLNVPSVESLVHLPPHGNALARLFHPAADLLRWLAGVRTGKFGGFQSCDLFALCGGGYLYSSKAPLLSRNLACLSFEILLAARTGRPVVQFPQSFGPVTKTADRWLIEKVCRALPRLTPRCEYSLRLLTEWGYASKARLMPDIVLLMRKLLPDFYSFATERRGLGITPINYRFALRLSAGEHERYLQNLVEACRHFHRRTGEPAVLFTQVSIAGSDDDSVMVAELAARLKQASVPHSRIANEAGLAEYVSSMGKLRAFIGSRMHACIFAFTTRTPAIGLAYQPKFEGVYKTLGMEPWLCPLNDWQSGWACDRLDEAIDRGEGLRGELDANMRAAETRLEAQLDSLFSAIPPMN